MILNYSDFIKENNVDFDFKEIFLKLTEYTIPFGYEKTLEPILYNYIPNLKQDSIGNYYITIGDSKTLFTSHLDTFSKKYEKINHIIKKGIIKTDGTTVLGGDNKNGVLILMYMIYNNVPGTYYFFIGEEGGVSPEMSCYGSTKALETYPNVFNKFDRAIAFDRRGEGSIVIKQRGRICASDEFADTLVDEFFKNGLEFKKDYAYGTDSAVFLDIIPEITNISSGGRFEHSFLESTDIKYLKKVANAAININWEKLPTIRKAEGVKTKYNKIQFSDRYFEEDTYKLGLLTFNRLKRLLYSKGFICINSNDFKTGAIMQFTKFTTDDYINIEIVGDEITIVDQSDVIEGFVQGGTFDFFKKLLNVTIDDLVKGVIGDIRKKMSLDYEISIKDLENILDDTMLTLLEFKEYIDKSDYRDFFEFKDDKVFMDIKAGDIMTIKRQKEQEKKI